MKRFLLIVTGLFLFAALLSAGAPAAGSPLEYKAMEGNWKLSGMRLYQRDDSVGSLKAHLTVPQDGLMVYEFNVRYEGGVLEDGHGGFGIHVFVDDPSNIKNSWGDGESVLLWLNYDANPYLDETVRGLSAEVYHSTNDSIMELAGSYNLNSIVPLLTKDLENAIIPVKIIIDGDTGRAWISDPSEPGKSYAFNLGVRNLEGDYVTLRTNSMAVSFGM